MVTVPAAKDEWPRVSAQLLKVTLLLILGRILLCIGVLSLFNTAVTFRVQRPTSQASRHRGEGEHCELVGEVGDDAARVDGITQRGKANWHRVGTGTGIGQSAHLCGGWNTVHKIRLSIKPGRKVKPNSLGSFRHLPKLPVALPGNYAPGERGLTLSPLHIHFIYLRSVPLGTSPDPP